MLFRMGDQVWCVMHSEPHHYRCDFEFFTTEEAALAYADGVRMNAADDGVEIRVFVTRVMYSTERRIPT